MALFDFLKRKKDASLDIPPPPPPDLDLPEMPRPKEETPRADEKPVHDISDLNLPELPDLPKMPDLDLPEHDDPDDPGDPDPTVPPQPEPVPDVPPIDPSTAPLPVDVVSESVDESAAESKHADPVHVEPMPAEKESPEKSVTKEPEVPEKHEHGPVYIKANYYVDVLKSVDTVLNKLKGSETIAKKLGDIKNEKDKEFERYRNYIEDIQRKSSAMDQTLFNG